MKIFTIVIIIFLAISCTSHDTMFNEIQKEIIINDNSYNVVIATDQDCITCLFSLQKTLNVNENTQGIYFSKHPKQLIIRLHKIFPNIKWKLSNNTKLLKLIKKESEEGPYLINIQNKKATYISAQNYNKFKLTQI